MSPSREENATVRDRIDALLASGDLAAVGELVAGLHPSDLADLVESLDDDRQVALLSALPAELASEALAEMEEGEDRGDLLSRAPSPEE